MFYFPPTISETLPLSKVSSRSKPYTAGDTPSHFSLGNGRLYTTTDKPLTSWGGYPYSVHPPEGWVSLDSDHRDRKRVLNTPKPTIMLCGAAEVEHGKIVFSAYVPQDQVYPDPPQTQQFVVNSLTLSSLPRPSLGIHSNASRSLYYISTNEPWDHATWLKLGRCEFDHHKWAVPTTEYEMLDSLFRLPAATHALSSSGLSHIYASTFEGELGVRSATLAQPQVAAKLFATPFLAHLPCNSKLITPAFSYSRITNVSVPSEAVSHVQWDESPPTVELQRRQKQLTGIELRSKFSITCPFIPCHNNILLVDQQYKPADVLSDEYIKIGSISREVGKTVGNLAFAEWAKQHASDCLYTVTFLTSGGHLKETAQTWVPKIKVAALKERIVAAGNWRHALEEDTGITLPSSASLTQEQANAYVAFQRAIITDHLVPFQDVIQYFETKWGIQINAKMSIPTLTEPFTFVHFCSLPDPHLSLPERLQTYFDEGDNLLQLLDCFQPNLSKMVGHYWNDHVAAEALTSLL
jgi:hypothetical protein